MSLRAAASVDGAVAFEAVGLLWILAMSNDANCAAVRAAGGVELLVALADPANGRSAAVQGRSRDALATVGR